MVFEVCLVGDRCIKKLFKWVNVLRGFRKVNGNGWSNLCELGVVLLGDNYV